MGNYHGCDMNNWDRLSVDGRGCRGCDESGEAGSGFVGPGLSPKCSINNDGLPGTTTRVRQSVNKPLTCIPDTLI